MKLIIDIPEEVYKSIQDNDYCEILNSDMYNVVKKGTPLDEKELKLKRWIEKDIETLNEIIESGWLISDYDKCTAIDACEDAITALKQYPVLDKIRAEIDEQYDRVHPYNISCAEGLEMALNIIDKYKAESEVNNG